MTLSGYTDNLGSREHNIALGDKRVDAVARALRAMRVAVRQIRTRSFGFEKARPLICVSEVCRQSRRSVEFRYSN